MPSDTKDIYRCDGCGAELDEADKSVTYSKLKVFCDVHCQEDYEENR